MHVLLNMTGFFLFVFTLICLLLFIVNLLIFFFKKRDFPRKTLTVTIIATAAFLGIFVYIQYFFTFDVINKEYMQEGPQLVLSPTGKYTANAYYEPYGGAGPSGGVHVWVEITNNEDKITKTVYYADAKNQFFMNWLDEDTLSIVNKDENPDTDRSIALTVEKEIYDENGLACKSVLMKNDYETCYQN